MIELCVNKPSLNMQVNFQEGHETVVVYKNNNYRPLFIIRDDKYYRLTLYRPFIN